MPFNDNNLANGCLNETDFKTTYIATFLASYSAWRYERDCMEGHPGKHYANQPVEDANHLANEAWKTLTNLLG